jgi:hypothetical protein
VLVAGLELVPKFQDHALIVPLPAVEVSVNVTGALSAGVVGLQLKEAVGEAKSLTDKVIVVVAVLELVSVTVKVTVLVPDVE